MRVLVAALCYGDRPHDIVKDNIVRAGYACTYIGINRYGVAQALNEGLHLMVKYNFDAVAFIANDITEPDNWLKDKVHALQTYTAAGVVASTIHEPIGKIHSQHIIGNWLVSREAFNRIGYFNEEFTPYGPIDLDYCERANLAGLSTYYVMNCHATHDGSHATGNEYGYDKAKVVADMWPLYLSNLQGYHNGTKSINIEITNYEKEG